MMIVRRCKGLSGKGAKVQTIKTVSSKTPNISHMRTITEEDDVIYSHIDDLSYIETGINKIILLVVASLVTLVLTLFTVSIRLDF